MAMTGVVKDELSRLTVLKPCCRKAEVSTLLRFAGGLHLVSGRIVIEAEIDTNVAARRLIKDISEVFGHTSEVVVLAPSGLRKGSRYVVRVFRDGESLARQTGLIDNNGRPVRGLPRHVVAGAACDAESAWRGAFLAHGSLTEPGRSMSLEVTCPGPEAALALVGAARRLKIHAKAREVRGVDRVVVRDGDAISALLTRLGAHGAVLQWEERRMRREVRATANRLANFDDANLRRSARAAVAAGARVARALEILGDDAPEHLVNAGRLRLEHKQASLEELGQLADPPLTKDAIAGRIRRLLAMADKRAGDQGIPGTDANLTAEMLAPRPAPPGRGRRVRSAGVVAAQDPLDEVAAELPVAGVGPHAGRGVGLEVRDGTLAAFVQEVLGGAAILGGAGAFVAGPDPQAPAGAGRAPGEPHGGVAVQGIEEAQRLGRDLGAAPGERDGRGERVPALVDQHQHAGQVGDAVRVVEDLPGRGVGVQGAGQQGADRGVAARQVGAVQQLAERDDLGGRLGAQLVEGGAVRRREHGARQQQRVVRGVPGAGRGHPPVPPQQQPADRRRRDRRAAQRRHEGPVAVAGTAPAGGVAGA